MNLQAVFRKTVKGDEEVATRACHLSARLRSVLIMVDGKSIGAELLKRASVLGDGEALVGALLDGGFIEAAERDLCTMVETGVEAAAAILRHYGLPPPGGQRQNCSGG